MVMWISIVNSCPTDTHTIEKHSFGTDTDSDTCIKETLVSSMRNSCTSNENGHYKAIIKDFFLHFN